MTIFSSASGCLYLGAKLISTNDRPLIFSVTFRLFPAGAKKQNAPHLHDPVGNTPRHVCRKFRAKYRRSDVPVFNIKQNLAKKRDPTLKSIHMKESRILLIFTHKSPSKYPRRFER